MAHPHGCAIYLYGWHIRNGSSPCKDRQQLTADMPQGGRSFSRLKTLVLHGLSPCVAKDGLLEGKRPSFAEEANKAGSKPWRSALWRHAPFAPFAPRCGAVVAVVAVVADGSRVRPRL